MAPIQKSVPILYTSKSCGYVSHLIYKWIYKSSYIQIYKSSYIQVSHVDMHLCMHLHEDFAGGTVVKSSPANAGNTGDVDSIPYLENPLEDGMATHPILLPGESH